MQTFIMIAQLITALSILVVIHELGHFLAAKLFKIKVDKFYLFFDFLFPMPNLLKFSLFKIKKGDTEYGIGWFPMGGYVQIAGMVDENMNTEQLAMPPQPWEFRSKPAWQRMIVMLGGIIFNIVLGIFIFAMMSYAYGEKNLINSSVSHGIIPSELAQEIGFKTGDKLISVNQKPIVHFYDAMNLDVIMTDGEIKFAINRNNIDTAIVLPKDFLRKLTKGSREAFFKPRMELYVDKVVAGSAAEKGGLKSQDKIIAVDNIRFETFDEFQPMLKQFVDKETSLQIVRAADTLTLMVKVDEAGHIGFVTTDITQKFDVVEYGFFSSIPAGVGKAYETINAQFAGWGKIFKGDIPVNKAVQGPVGIAQYFGPVWDWANFWMLTALISLGLAFANVLPIPALDGGHVVLLLIEMISGKPISIKIQERVQTVGMVILLSLMVLIFGNDIWQIIKK